MKQTLQLKSKCKMRFFLSLFCLFAFLGTAFAQPQTLEVFTSSATPGSTANQNPKTLTFFKNTDNPTGNNFSPFSPTTTATFSISKQKFDSIEGNKTVKGLNFGGSTGGTNNIIVAANDFLMQGSVGGPSVNHFSSSALNIGSGISVAATNPTNYAMSIMMYSDALINASGVDLYPRNAKVYYGDITVTFNTPVANPIFHISGLGGDTYLDGPKNWSYLGYAGRLELATGSNYRLSKLSGSKYFNITDTSVDNSSARKGFATNGANTFGTIVLPDSTYGASGSFMVIGTTITSVTFRMYLVGDGGRVGGNYDTTNIHWSVTNQTNGERFLMGVDIPLTQSISGAIFNDQNGVTNSSIDGDSISIASGKQLYVSLVNSSGGIVQTIPVNPDGSYKFSGVILPNSTYNIVLDTLAAGSTTSSLPADWYNTSEAITPSFQDGNTNGITSVTVGALDVTGVNFGIQQPPTAVTDTVPTQLNPGGTTNVTVPATYFDGNDQNGGTVDSITITSFPTNATTITIDNVTYTSSTFPASGVAVPTDVNGNPTQAIAIDPIDGGITSVITYTATDNGGAVSAPATIDVPFIILSISGTVFNDNDAGVPDGTVPPATTVKLYDAFNNEIATTTTDASGNYSFDAINPGSYNVVIVPPAGFSNVSSTDASPLDGYTSITVNTTDVTGINFGINEPPTADTTVVPAQVNPGGNRQVIVPATNFDGTDPNGGIITSIKLQFPTNAESITVDGIEYTFNTYPPSGYITVPVDANGNPTQVITVNPVDGATTAVFTYYTTDNAGLNSLPATVDVPFTVLSITGTVFNDVNGLTDSTVNGIGTNVPDDIFNMKMYALLVDNSTSVPTPLALVPVDSNGVYQFTNVNAGNYSITLTQYPDWVSTPVLPSPGGYENFTILPYGFVSTGEHWGNGMGSDDSVNTILSLGNITANVTEANFGIERAPVPTINQQPTQLNPGDTISVSFPGNAFSVSSFNTENSHDFDGGKITGVVITQFPPVTSITIDGVKYTTLEDIQAAYPGGIPADSAGVLLVPIAIDPSDDGSHVVRINYAVVDNANVQSLPFGYDYGYVELPFYAVPIANPDRDSTPQNTMVTIPVVTSNDDFGADSPSSMSITEQPKNGTAIVNDGGTPNDPTDDQIDYTPNPGFTGADTLIYEICTQENGGGGSNRPGRLNRPTGIGNCDTAMVIITVTTAEGPLPVLLTSFNMNSNGNVVNLTWSVAQETGVKDYEILFSADGTNFKSVGSVTATNSSNYGFTFISGITGNNYYRIKTIDKDGKVTYSVIKMIRLGNNEAIQVYPNPVKTQVNILLSDSWINKEVKVSLYNQLGQLVINKQIKSSRQTEYLNVSHLLRGVYTLKLQRSDNTIEIRKIQIMN